MVLEFSELVAFLGRNESLHSWVLKDNFSKCYCEYEKNRAVVLHTQKTTTFVHMIDISETRFSPLSNKITVTNIQPDRGISAVILQDALVFF